MSFVRPAICALLICLSSLVLFSQAQDKKTGVLEASELKTLVPSNYFFDGLVASVQSRNSSAVRFKNGKHFVAALVDNSGYSSDVQAKYQGLLITDTKVMIGDAELTPGQYGFGFTADGNFVVLLVSTDEVLHAKFQQDDSLKRPVPLKIVEEGDTFRLYAGRKYVGFKTK